MYFSGVGGGKGDGLCLLCCCYVRQTRLAEMQFATNPMPISSTSPVSRPSHPRLRQEAARILVPGGVLYVNEYHPFRRIWNDETVEAAADPKEQVFKVSNAHTSTPHARFLVVHVNASPFFFRDATSLVSPAHHPRVYLTIPLSQIFVPYLARGPHEYDRSGEVSSESVPLGDRLPRNGRIANPPSFSRCFPMQKKVEGAEDGTFKSYEFNHTVSDYVTAVLQAGARVCVCRNGIATSDDWFPF